MGKRGSEAAPGGLSESSVYVVWTKETGTFVKTSEDSFIDERNDDEGNKKVFDME